MDMPFDAAMSPLDPEEISKQPLGLQIDIVTDAFLQSWKNGERPSTSEFTSLVSPELRNELLSELILTERQLQIKQCKSEEMRSPNEDAANVGGKDTRRLQPSLPSRIGHYELRYILGRGASGVVYAAVDLSSERLVALKLPHPHLIGSKEDSQRFLREARNAERLKHSSIVEFLQVGHTEAGPFLVYEYLYGLDLCSYIKAGVPLTMDVKLQLVADVARALQYAHDQGLVHRDLKPSNLMVVLAESAGDNTRSNRLKVKILDFGIARLLDAATILTNAGELLGTPAYMSPEQAGGQSQTADNRADIYGLGVIFYELLTGSTPFRGSAAELVDQIRQEEVPMLRSTHPAICEPVATICHRCLRLHPAHRYPRIVEIAEDIERFLRGESILAKPIGTWERTRSAWKRKQLTRIAITACIAISATMLVIVPLSFFYRKPRPELWLSVEKTTLVQALIKGFPNSIESYDLLIDALPSATVDDLASLAETPTPYLERMVELLELYKNDFADRLNTVETNAIDGVLALLDTRRGGGKVSDEALARWIRERISDTDAGAAAWYDLLGSRAVLISESLEKVYREETISSKRIAMSRLLVAIHYNDDEKLISFVDTLNPEELSVWANGIGRDRLDSLQIPWRDFDTDDGFQQISEADCVKQANRILAIYAIGNAESLFQSLEDRKDPRIRTYVTHRIRDTKLTITSLMEAMLDENTKPDVLYGLLTILSFAEQNAFERSLKEKIGEWLIKSYEYHPDAGVHAMCRVLLGRGNRHSEMNSADRRLIDEGIVRDREWFVNLYGMHMAIIKGNVDFWMGLPKGKKPALFDNLGHLQHIEQSYAIGMDEVSVGQYRLFDPEFAKGESDDSPAGNLSWDDCVLYCNWLNRHESLDEIVVELGPDNSRKLTTDTIHGYRLPKHAEWEYASRAKTSTSRFHGCDETPFTENFFCATLSSGKSSILPNRFGLSNSISSKSEWTMTNSSEYAGSIFRNCGGSTVAPDFSRNNSQSSFDLAISKSPTTGMRIVRCTPIFD